jgi:hypothetical protein
MLFCNRKHGNVETLKMRLNIIFICMKKKCFILLVLIGISSISGHLYAQEVNTSGKITKSRSNIQNNRVCVVTIIPTENGSTITFDNDYISPRDAASGLPTGKRQHKPYLILKEYNISSSDNNITEVISPRDEASGLPTGKRQHKPMTITKELDKSSPLLSNKNSNTVLTSGKVSIRDFSFLIKNKGVVKNLPSVDGECILSSDLPNGKYVLTVSWSWGATQSNSSKRSVDFLLEIEDGIYMAISEQGIPSKKK